MVTFTGALIFVALYNLLFFQVQIGLISLVIFSLLNSYFFLTSPKEAKNIGWALTFSLISIAFSLLVPLRASGIIQAIDFLAACLFLSLSILLIKLQNPFNFSSWLFVLSPLLIFKNFISQILSFFNSDQIYSTKVDKNTSSFLIRGLIITTPIFLILLFLLVQADPIFGKLGQDLLNNLGQRAVFSIFVFVCLVTLGLMKVVDKLSNSESIREVNPGKFYELLILIGSLCLLFSAFLLIQIRYLFIEVNEGDLKELGINVLTYSDYVRRGFFELIIASIIISLVLTYILKFIHHIRSNFKLPLQLLSGFLTLETLMLLASAVKRLALYEAAHGLTRARILGFIFLVWLALLLIIFVVKIFQEIPKSQFFVISLVISLLALLSVNFVNIDGLIATNFKPTVNKEVDYFYLTNLSADASDSWPEAVFDSEQTLNSLKDKQVLDSEDNRKLYWAGTTLEQIKAQTDYLKTKYLRPMANWQAFNLGEYLAFQDLDKNQQIFDRVPNLLELRNQIQKRVGDKLKNTTRYDRDLSPPLVF